MYFFQYLEFVREGLFSLFGVKREDVGFQVFGVIYYVLESNWVCSMFYFVGFCDVYRFLVSGIFFFRVQGSLGRSMF